MRAPETPHPDARSHTLWTEVEICKKTIEDGVYGPNTDEMTGFCYQCVHPQHSLFPVPVQKQAGR